MIALPLDLLEGVAEEAEVELRKDYSGRFMYGALCVGVVGDAAAGVRFTLELLQAVENWNDYLSASPDTGEEGEDLDELKGILTRDVASDEMGKDMIFYWKGLQAR
jgi:hypothetical protein